MNDGIFSLILGKHICHKQDEVNQFLKDRMLNNFSDVIRTDRKP